MLGVAPRFDAEGFKSYFADDFQDAEENRIWAVEDGKEIINDARTMASIVPMDSKAGVVGEWRELSRGVFFDRMDRLVAALSRWKRRRVCALELTFSPPKSFSIVALAGPHVVLKLCEIHAKAVDFVLEIVPQFLFARRTKSPWRVPVGVDLLRFRHPFSFLNDPQLHDHVDLVWPLDGPALHSYPLFFHQLALRQCYHYALVSGLKREGFGVRIDEGGIRSWELEGIDDGVIETFSKRRTDIELAADRLTNYYSRGAALRYTALSSRALLPQTEAGFTLAKARDHWRNEVAASRCSSRIMVREESSELQFGGLKQYFRSSAVTTRPILEGRILAACLGQPVPGPVALQQIRCRVEEAIGREEIVAGDGGTLCDPETYRHERAITRLVFAGRGKGVPRKLVSGEPLRAERAAAARPDQIRFVAGGSALPEPADPEAFECTSFDVWDAAVVREMLEDRELDEMLISVAERPHVGDFLHFISRVGTAPGESSLSRSHRFLVGGRPVQVVKGQIPRNATQGFGVLDRLDGRGLVVVPGDYPEGPRRVRNMRRARAELEKVPDARRSQLMELEEVISWEGMGADFQWRNRRLHSFKTNPLLAASSRRTVLGVVRGGILVVRSIVQRRLIRIEDLLEHRDSIALVRPYNFRLHEGAVLETMLPCMRRGKKKISLRKGEVVVVKSVLEDGSIKLADGRIVPPDFRAFYPATLVREFAIAPRMEPSAVICEDDGRVGVLKRLAPFARARMIIVLTDSVDGFRVQFAREKRLQLQERRDRSICCRLDGKKPYLVFPPLNSWEAKVEEVLEWAKEISVGREREPGVEPVAGGMDEPMEKIVPKPVQVKATVQETERIAQVTEDHLPTPIKECAGEIPREIPELLAQAVPAGNLGDKQGVPLPVSDVTLDTERSVVRTAANNPLPQTISDSPILVPERRDSSPLRSSKDQEVANKDEIGQTFPKPTTPPAELKPQKKPSIRKKSRSKDAPGDMNI